MLLNLGSAYLMLFKMLFGLPSLLASLFHWSQHRIWLPGCTACVLMADDLQHSLIQLATLPST
jgi:hypothetical protein